MPRETLKGKYYPTNPSKYKGDPTKCIYRSSWERKVMFYFDRSPSIIQWNSEETIIPYVSPIDNRFHRYFPDFWILAKTNTGEIFEALVEIKPHKQVIEPKKPTTNSWPSKKRYLQESAIWSINQAKWKAAKQFCDDRKMKFIILTEKTIHATTKSVS